MNKFISLIIFLAIGNFVQAQCNADFTGTILFGCAPVTTNFTDASTNAVTWDWDFGDGNSSNLQNPSHTYTTPGVYTVTLDITSGDGCSDTRIRNFYVQAIGPNVNFGADILQGCNTLNVSFTDSTIFGAPIISWTWNFGDGNMSFFQNPTHLYTTIGAYDVSLTITDIDGCLRKMTKTQFINVDGPNGTDTRTECNSYTWIDGNIYTMSNNTATYNIIGGAASGCDSLVTLDLTINNSTTGTDTRTECDSYTWIDGGTYTMSNNIATHNIIGGAANGCDSLVSLDLTIINSAIGTDNRTECDSYTWIDGATYTISNNTATHNIIGGAANGCDSLVSLDLTIINAVNGTDTRTECNSYTWIDGNNYTTTNNTATHNITNGAANGCDSLITLNLTIIYSTMGTDTRTECDNYTWIDGATYSISNNTATHNIIGGAANGCDSLVTLDLTIINSTTGTDTKTECNSYTWIDGGTYTISNNTATHNIIGGAANGCDSLVSLDLTIIYSTTGIDSRTECDEYIWIDGGTYSASNNTATYNIIGGAANGCDSLVNLDLTIIYSETGTDTHIACDEFTWIDGSTYYVSYNSSTFNFVGGAANGCDSLVTLDLTILYSATGTDTRIVCDSFTWIDGVTYTMNNNSATYNIDGGAANGCDSLVTLELTIINSSTGIHTLTACEEYTWIDSITYTSNNSIAMHNIIGGAVNGCDSLVSLDLTIINTALGIDTQAACSSYTWIDGNNYTSDNNTATHNIVGGAANGCDSLVTLDLIITTSAMGIDTRTQCFTYTWIDGNTYTSDNNTATHLIVGGAANGCDSLVTLDLTIVNFVTSVVQSGPNLTADESGAGYQWLDCDNGFAIIPGETNQSFNAISNGNYCVKITKNNCVAISDCYTITGVGTNENDFDQGLLLYPNPTDSDFTIDLGSNYESVTISITDINGKIIQSHQYDNIQLLDLQLEEPSGVYMLIIESKNKKAIIRLVKE